MKNTPEDLWTISAKALTAQKLLRALASSDPSDVLPSIRLLIAYPDQLHNFVQTIPTLAWELLEYATEPLEVVYPLRKVKIKEEGESLKICVRWVKQPKLLRFLQKYGPHWALLDAKVTTLPAVFAVKDCYDKQYPYQVVRTMVINEDNSFSFIR